MSSFETIHCARCGTIIRIPPFTTEEKSELMMSRKDIGPASALEKVRAKTGFGPTDLKALMIHMNETGHCNRCSYSSLEGENVICPKCQSFNLNWE